jgi:hypothetical protein
MENPHEERQAVLLERIIKNVVRSVRGPVLLNASPSALIVWPHHITGQMQRSHHGDEPLSSSEFAPAYN